MFPSTLGLVIVACAVSIAAASKTPGICGKLCTGGPFDLCVQCPSPCPITCKNRNSGPTACPAYCVANGCECAEGYVRDDNGKCILPSQCPTTTELTCPNCKGPSSVCSSCYNSCQPTCRNILFQEPLGPCLVTCGGKFCVCAKDYYVGDDGLCVLEKECIFHIKQNLEPAPVLPRPPLVNPGGPMIPAPPLINPGGPMIPAPPLINPGGVILPPPLPLCNPLCTGGPHDRCTSCGSRCPLTCDNLNPNTVCTADCVVNVCRCEPGYARAFDGKCVLPENCPAKVGTCKGKKLL